MMTKRLILAVLLVLPVLSACRDSGDVETAQFLVFGTLLDVSVRGTSADTADQAFQSLQQEFQRMHREWHAWEPGLLTEINAALAAGLPARANSDIIRMIRAAQEVETLSGGRFNPAIGALIEKWGFHTSVYPIEGPPPSPDAIEKLLDRRPSSLDLRIEGEWLSTTNTAVQLDFGGIAKGFAIDLACAQLRALGIENAIINAGGDLRAIGDHGDRPWRIAIRDPQGGIIGTMATSGDEAVFTSGVYERFRRDQTRRYPHILDPRTGWPVQELASVTVIADEGMLADAAATALIVAGPGEWKEVAAALGLDQVLLIDGDGNVLLTRKMHERVEFSTEVPLEIF